MVNKYKRKSNRQEWEEKNMKLAIESIKKSEMGWLKAARIFNVPQATLRRRVLNQNKNATGTDKVLGAYKTTFSKDVETQLVSHIKLLESRLFGLTCVEVRKLAYQLAEKNGIKHRFDNKNKIAGKDWLRGFRLRNPQISLRQPEATSAARARGFNKTQVKQFFDILQHIIDKEKISFHNIWNVDESGLSTVQKPRKIFAQKGRKQVGSLTSAERGQNTTITCCMSSTGQFVPPIFIFKRKNWKVELLEGAPAGSLGFAQESGWMTSELFLQWLKHFVKWVVPSVEKKVLLLVDGHVSHKSLEVITYAKQNNVILLSFPPHCTHRLQPLDVSFYGPLKTYYNTEVTMWLKNNPGRIVGPYQIAKLFSGAYGKAARHDIAINGFLKTGICPLNPNIFPNELFLAAEVTDIPLCTENTENESPNPRLCKTPNNSPVHSVTILENRTLCAPSAESILSTSFATYSPVDVLPLPISSNIQRRKKPSLGSQVLTSTPYVKEAKEKEVCKRALEQRKAAKKAKRNFKMYETEEVQPFEADGDEDVPCLYCNELWSASKDNWVQCQMCSKWAHCECAGFEKTQKIYVCELCK